MLAKLTPHSALMLMALVAVPAWADDSATAPETLLAEQSATYLRFDGFGSHRDAYNETTLAHVLHDEFQPLIDDLSGRILDALGPQLLSERLLEGVAPDQLLKVQSANKQIPHLVEYLKQNGAVVGVELISPLAPQFQVTIVFPGGGRAENLSALMGGFQLLGLVNGVEVGETKVGERLILSLATPEPVKVACWKEGEHVVLTVGTEDIKHTLQLISGKRKNLTANSKFKKLAEFDSYETIQRGFFDLEQLTNVAKETFPPSAMFIEKLGLEGLKNVALHVGFEGPQLRNTVLLDMPAEGRKGLLRLFSSQEEIDFESLPKFAPDSMTVAVSRFDVTEAYDIVIDLVTTLMGTFDPGGLKELQDGLKGVESSLGVNLRNDVLAQLDSTVFVQSSPSDGPINMGMAVGFRVKDEKKLTASLRTLVQSLSATTDADVSLDTRKYHGATLNMVNVNEQGFFFQPTYTVHNGWLVIGLFPQSVQGYIYRCEEGRQSWQPPQIAKQAVETTESDAQLRVTGISVVDPRPTIEQILTFAPLMTKAITSFSGSGDFDVSLIPNTQSVNERLTQNVSVAIDDGRQLRIEGYSSIPMPFQVTGLEIYLFATAIAFSSTVN